MISCSVGSWLCIYHALSFFNILGISQLHFFFRKVQDQIKQSCTSLALCFQVNFWLILIIQVSPKTKLSVTACDLLCPSMKFVEVRFWQHSFATSVDKMDHISDGNCHSLSSFEHKISIVAKVGNHLWKRVVMVEDGNIFGSNDVQMQERRYHLTVEFVPLKLPLQSF